MIKYLVLFDIPLQQFHRAVITPVKIVREERHGWWVNFLNDPNPVFRSRANYSVYDREYEAVGHLKKLADNHRKTCEALAKEWRAVNDKPEIK